MKKGGGKDACGVMCYASRGTGGWNARRDASRSGLLRRRFMSLCAVPKVLNLFVVPTHDSRRRRISQYTLSTRLLSRSRRSSQCALHPAACASIIVIIAHIGAYHPMGRPRPTPLSSSLGRETDATGAVVAAAVALSVSWTNPFRPPRFDCGLSLSYPHAQRGYGEPPVGRAPLVLAA